MSKISAVSKGGGTSIAPATTVVTEVSPSQSPSVGVSLNYAREDHTHGTPAAGASGNWPIVQNSTGVSDVVTIPAGFQLIVVGSFTNLGSIINLGGMAIL